MRTTDELGVAPEITRARAYLSRVAEPASVPVWAYVRRVGPVDAAESIRSGRVDDAVRAATGARARSTDPDADLESAARHAVRLVVPESPDWPVFAFAALERAGERRLLEIASGRPLNRVPSGELIPPLALWVKGPGSLPASAFRSVALVGSRTATAYGQHMAAELAYGLAGHGVTVVSGGAYGIDAAAHRGCLAADGQTVVVSAGGIDRPYPAGNAGLYEQAAVTGLVLSESPPGRAPQRSRFLSRNRLIAALSSGVVIVEAAVRSGALNTASHAAGLGRALMVVPGPVTSAMSAGCHALLRRDNPQAVLVESVDHVLQLVGSSGEGFEIDGPEPVIDAVRTALDRLDPVSRQVYEGLPARRAVDEQRLAQLSGAGIREVIMAIPVLRLAGLLESSDEGHRIAPALRSARGSAGPR